MGVRAAWQALLGNIQTKASETGPLVAMQHLGRPVWTQRDIAAIADVGYRKQVIAARSVDIIAQAAASVPWLLFRGQDQDTAIEDHPLLSLLKRPNPIMGGGEFFTSVVSYLMIAGNEYIERVGPDTGPPIELWPLRPDRMKVIAGATGLPQGFRYSVGGRHKDWQVDPVTGQGPILHLRCFNPLDDWYGLAPMEHALNSIDIRNEADRWNKALLQNSARPSGALVYSPKEGDAIHLSDEQRAQIKEDLEKRMAGPSNAGRPPILDGSFQWLEMGLSPKDMDWLEAKNISGRDIGALGPLGRDGHSSGPEPPGRAQQLADAAVR
jgi:HK97 family phage portal protein